MKRRTVLPLLTLLFSLAGLAAFGGAAARAQCLPASECDALRAQIRDFRQEVRPIRRELRELRRQAADLPRNGAERKRIRRRARELAEELRRERQAAQIRDLVRAYRSGCRNC